MKEVIIVAGLPGSGKTTWCRKQVFSLKEKAVLVDDPSVNPEQWEDVSAHHDYIFVADPYFCIMKPQNIQKMLEDNLSPYLSSENPINIRWVCMENKLEECLARAREGVEQFSKRLSKRFYVPSQAQVIPISGVQSPFWTIPLCDTIVLSPLSQRDNNNAPNQLPSP